MHDIAYMELEKKTCNGICLQNRNRLRDIENKLWLPKIKDRGGIN